MINFKIHLKINDNIVAKKPAGGACSTHHTWDFPHASSNFECFYLEDEEQKKGISSSLKLAFKKYPGLMKINNSYLLNNIFRGFWGAVCFVLIWFWVFIFNYPTLTLLPVSKERKMDRVAKLLTGRNLRLLKRGGR